MEVRIYDDYIEAVVRKWFGTNEYIIPINDGHADFSRISLNEQ